jgi:DNA polymerase III subunit beta
MDLNIDQSSLGRALRLVSRVTPARTTVPILETALLEAEPGRLTLAAADGQIGLVTTLAADVDRPGRAAVPARLLAEYVAQLPAEPLRLELDGARPRLRVSCGRFSANLASVDPDEFPVFPAADEGAALDLDARRLQRAIERVVFAAARDESRPVLTAVLFERGADGLTLAAADGFRLARARVAEGAGAARPLLVPARVAAEFGRLLADAQAACLLPTADGAGLHLVAGGTTLFTRLVDGSFPDIERVIPREWRTRVTVEAASFRQAVRVAGLFGKDGQVRPVVLEARPDRLRLLARGDEIGEAESELAAVVEGEPQPVALNTRLLVDLLDAVEARRLELSWAGPQTPVVVREADAEGSPDLSVVMPLHDPALARHLAEAA